MAGQKSAQHYIINSVRSPIRVDGASDHQMTQQDPFPLVLVFSHVQLFVRARGPRTSDRPWWMWEPGGTQKAQEERALVLCLLQLWKLPRNKLSPHLSRWHATSPTWPFAFWEWHSLLHYQVEVRLPTTGVDAQKTVKGLHLVLSWLLISHIQQQELRKAPQSPQVMLSLGYGAKPMSQLHPLQNSKWTLVMEISMWLGFGDDKEQKQPWANK